MSNNNGNSEKRIIEYLKSEYDLARHEWEYYTELFNRQDNLYSIYFAIFAVIIGAIYYIIQVNNKDKIFDNIILLNNQKMIICGLIIFLSVTYMYLFIIMMGNSYYLIIYSEKVIVLEKLLNYFLNKKVFIWETDFMAKIQSKDNIFTQGYLNVNMLKMIFAITLYCVVEIPLCILWYSVIGNDDLFYWYVVIVLGVSLFLVYDWIIMWWRLPKHYREELETIYKNRLNVRL